MNRLRGHRKPLTILLVDDAELIRLYLRRRLEQIPGLKVTREANDVPAAIEAYDRTAPDVLVLDLQLPSGSGLDVLRYARSRGGDCLAIMLSGAMDEQQADVCFRAGADHCFNKAAEFKCIRDAILDYEAKRPSRSAD